MTERNVGAAIAWYRARHAHPLPATLDDLKQPDPITGGPYLEKITADPWGQPYVDRVLDAARGSYELRSAGDDRRVDTDDDVVFPERAPGP